MLASVWGVITEEGHSVITKVIVQLRGKLFEALRLCIKLETVYLAIGLRKLPSAVGSPQI